MNIQTLKIEDLTPDPNNARQHDEKNLAAIRASISEFRQVEPLVVQAKTNRIIGGNGRYQVMRQMGWKEAECVVVDVDDHKAASMALALNRTGALAEWDEAQLAETLRKLSEEDPLAPMRVGFDEKEYRKLLMRLNTAPEGGESGDDSGVEVDDEYQVVVHCKNEQQQIELLEKMQAEGYECSALTL